MRSSVLAVAVLVAASGCLAGEPVESAVGEGAQDVGDAPQALPDDREGEFAAFQETNATEAGVGGVDHAHDYWLGRDRVELIHDRLAFNPYGLTQYRGIPLPQGAVVYEGTAAVEVLLKDPQRHACFPAYWENGKPKYCTDTVGGPGVDDPRPPPVLLEYKHAAASEWIPAGEITWGKPTVLPVAPKETDMPHSLGTLWAFRVQSKESHLSATSSFDATVTIVRGADIPEWPGHPDLYANGHWRHVLEGVGRTKEPGVHMWLTGTDTDWNYTAVSPDKLISWGTRTLYVWVNVTKIQATPIVGFSEWWLGVRNATGRWSEALPILPPEDPSKPGPMLFVVPVDDAGMDSPYAVKSRWEFELWPYEVIQAGDQKVYAYGTVPFDVEFQISAVATDLPAEAYSETCC